MYSNYNDTFLAYGCLINLIFFIVFIIVIWIYHFSFLSLILSITGVLIIYYLITLFLRWRDKKALEYFNTRYKKTFDSKITHLNNIDFTSILSNIKTVEYYLGDDYKQHEIEKRLAEYFEQHPYCSIDVDEFIKNLEKEYEYAFQKESR